MLTKFILSFFLILFFSEGLLWIVRPSALEFYRIQKTYHALEPNYLIDLEPNVNVHVKHFQKFFEMDFTTNEYGFRGSPNVNNALPQIVCIGDSVTMGFGVSDKETFCNKLNGFTNTKGISYQALNLGVDAYGPTHINLKLEKFLPKLNTKILYYFPSNGDNIDEVTFYSKKNNPKAMFLFNTQFQLAKYSYLFIAAKMTQENLIYRFNETFIWPIQKVKKTQDCLKSLLPADRCTDAYFPYTPYSLKEDFIRPDKRDPFAAPVYPSDECSDTPVNFDTPQGMLDQIDKMVNLTASRNIKLVLFLAPIDLETAYCSQKGKFHHYYSYLSTLKKYLQEKKIDFVDLNEYTKEMTYQGQMNVRPYYIFGDGHYTAMGNEWVYQIVKKKTEEVLDSLEK